MAYSGLIFTMENFGSTYVTLGDVKKKKSRFERYVIRQGNTYLIISQH